MQPSQSAYAPLGILIVLAFSGCEAPVSLDSQDQEPVAHPVAADETVDLSGKSPDELRSILDDAAVQSEQVAGFLSSGVNYQMRLKEFRRHINTGAAAAEAIAQHADMPDADRQNVLIERFRLLYSGAQTDPTAFIQLFTAEVAAALEEDPDSKATIYAEALLLEQSVLSSDEGDEAEKLAALEDFAARRPDDAAAVALFLQYGDSLERSGNSEAALNCYRAAVKAFPDSPHLGSVRQRLARIAAAVRSQQAAESAHRARVARIKNKLGASNGYFVVYTHETGKTMYRFEYDVFHGADEAVAHILRLPEKWNWDLTARFPESQDGYSRAMELRNERLKKETAMTIPVFN